MGELDGEMVEVQQKLAWQQDELRGLGETMPGTILTVNMHSAILNSTLHTLEFLTEVIKADMTYVRAIRDLMQDLLREISVSVNTLSGGKIPAYLVPIEMVGRILRSATSAVVRDSFVVGFLILCIVLSACCFLNLYDSNFSDLPPAS